MNILCVIPSRLDSTRLPQKPLLPIQGKPMIQWVIENASRCKALTKIIVATDSEKIAAVVHSAGGETIITDPNIQTGSDRAAVVAREFPNADVVVNLQGDEPFIRPSMLSQLVAPYLAGQTPEMTTLAYPLDYEKHANNPGAVKVVIDQNDNALYFSRAPIPYFRTENPAPVYHHIGVYAFRADFLQHYTTLPQTPLELTESLEQLRVLENGYSIRVCLTQQGTLEINTPQEYELAQQYRYEESL